jgi:hypothetical protein
VSKSTGKVKIPDFSDTNWGAETRWYLETALSGITDEHWDWIIDEAAKINIGNSTKSRMMPEATSSGARSSIRIW